MKGHRASILHFLQDPYKQPIIAELIDNIYDLNADDKMQAKQIEHTIKNDVFEYYADGVLIVDQGKVVAVYSANDAAAAAQYANVEVTTYANTLITPGFVDTHSHFPQTEMLGAYGNQLLDWLQQYTFPTEAAFACPEHCERVAKLYVDSLLSNGTTTANVFCSVHTTSVDALFNESQRHNLRMIGGKVLMDRNCPDNLQDTAVGGVEDSEMLIQKYHNKGRFSYAITPRFAPTSTPQQLELAGALYKKYQDDGVFMHTHLCESPNEIEWVKSLFPERKDYLDVYDHAGLIGPRCVFAHCVHLNTREEDRLAETKSTISFCPTSNLFLGSGLFNLNNAQDKGIRVGIGTDTAAGTSYNIPFATMLEAYKIQQLQQAKLDPFRSFYLATLGGASSLWLDDKIGNFLPGKEADFVRIALDGKSSLACRMKHNKLGLLHDLLFTLITLADDRNIAATYSLGEVVYQKP